MSSEITIKVEGLSKCYQIYDTPRDRLKQFILPRVQRVIGKQPQQYYREFWALQDISFEVKKGETIGIIGRNGSGKSTLLQLICRTLNPTSGSIATHGRIAALLELGSGFNPEFTGRENVYMNAAVLGLSKEETDARFDDIVAFADIGDFIEQPVKTYSSGMYVRLAFAVIAHVDADILIIDEALAVGDAFFIQKCMRYIRQFYDNNGTLLFVSHDTSAIRSLCNRAMWLDKGFVIQVGDSKEISEKYLEAFYEAQQGKSTVKKNTSQKYPLQKRKRIDQRLQYLNVSNLRNDLQIFSFSFNLDSFGKNGAQITNVELQDCNGTPLSWVVGGEDVCLHVEAVAYENLDSPIIGFYVTDKLGQCLFGDNTYLTSLHSPVGCIVSETLYANFTFQMPRLPVGDYSITVAIANGSQQEHIQHHWIHDAIIFKSTTSSVASGLIGIPMYGIELGVINDRK